ncbi:hypothetical protein [Rhodoferax sp.]|uniref:hypothetical protein n=1 Tax=Rhodoferax sp. TaxID=50421 RepID=UPI002ACD7FD5|nr:hypothetical protein [Rhodoferax sp.]MDZ7921960.1 hypothetical protein [Rhodoferax sp.]
MKPDKPPTFPATSKPGPAKPYDSLLDPLPLPDVTESDTDTAWGLWEASVEGTEKKPGAEAPPDFEPTVPVDLDKLFPKS